MGIRARKHATTSPRSLWTITPGFLAFGVLSKRTHLSISVGGKLRSRASRRRNPGSDVAGTLAHPNLQSGIARDVKKFFKIFGAVSLLIIAAFAILFVNTKLYDREVSAYANDAILAIATNWDEQALLQRASPELFAAATQQNIHDTFLNYRQLGRMTKYNVARSLAHVDVGFTLVHKKVTAVYIAKAAFEHGTAQVKLSLIKRNGRWYITGLHVTADRLDAPSALLPEGSNGKSGQSLWNEVQK